MPDSLPPAGDWRRELDRPFPGGRGQYLAETAAIGQAEEARDQGPEPNDRLFKKEPRPRTATRDRPSPQEIEGEWQKFLRRHGHLDEDGRVIHTERLQREVGFTGLKSLYHAALHGDIRAAEVLVRTCLAQPRAPLEVRVRQMDRTQLASREQELLAALPASMRGEVEEALARAAGPVMEGETP